MQPLEDMLPLPRDLFDIRYSGADARRKVVPDVASGYAHSFTFKDLLVAVGYFNEANFIGEGGFGKVYKGKINGQMVAVKQLARDGVLGRGAHADGAQPSQPCQLGRVLHVGGREAAACWSMSTCRSEAWRAICLTILRSKDTAGWRYGFTALFLSMRSLEIFQGIECIWSFSSMLNGSDSVISFYHPLFVDPFIH
ncbi:putative serine/threonine-protein kinase PBL21 [Zea mays]|uniref:Putative serine/threonine-protein kinase PBL21 n=1 Tax=Zea mays TaxID=4577 RepID=A0A3L6EY38_MAIZE|nr:putative serine/threonine-protein kinase PBL21 [Zea mays]